MALHPVSGRPLACLLLATTALCTAPAARAQVGTAPPPAFANADDNGVDLFTGEANFTLEEGSIGDGKGALSLVRSWAGASGWVNNWSGGLYLTTENGATVMKAEFGGTSESFTMDSTGNYVPKKANGATLTNLGDDSYRYVAGDGTEITYLTRADGFRLRGSACRPEDATNCSIPTSIKKPDGTTFNVQWAMHGRCKIETQGGDCGGGTYFYRFAGVTSSSGYAFTILYATDNPGTALAPVANWTKRTGATFTNTVSPPATLPTVTYAYPDPSTVEVTDTRGKTWRFGYESGGRLASVRRPGAGSDTLSLSYGANGVSVATNHGVTTSYARTPGTGTVTTVVTNALSQSTTAVFDTAKGRVTSITDAASNTTGFQYDASARLERTTSPEGNYVHLTYDSRGNVTERRAVAKNGSPADIVTTAVYPSTCTDIKTCNQPTSTTDARGKTTDYTYDATHGGVLTETAPAPTSTSARPQTRYSYTLTSGVYLLTGVSACVSGSSCTGTANETKTSIGYGANNLPVTVSSGSGDGLLTATRTFVHDPIGNLISVDGPLSGNADTVQMRYDSGRRRIGTISPDPDAGGTLQHRARRNSYDPATGLATKTEQGTVSGPSDTAWAAFAPQQAIEFAYDLNFRPVTGKLVVGGATQALGQISYDSVGRMECTALRMNPTEWTSLPSSACALDTAGSGGPDRITKIVYDAVGRTSQVFKAFGVSGVEAADSTTTYTGNGLVQTVMDAENNKTSYEYDGHDRLKKTFYPVTAKGAAASATGDYEELTYDAGSNVTKLRNRAGQEINFSHDDLGRLTLKDLPNTILHEQDIAYTYDLLGRLTSATTAGYNYQVGFTFDALGRVKSRTSSLGTLSYDYDPAGRRTRITHPDGFYADYDYLVTGEVSKVRENGATSGMGVLASYDYDDLGRRTKLTRGNGTVTDYAFTSSPWLTQLKHDIAGSVTAQDLTIDFTHNRAGQIASGTRSNDLYSWNGHYNINRAYTSNGLNQYSQSGSITPTYDTKGNLTSAGSASYGYTAENKLATAPSGNLGYDPLGRLYILGGELRLLSYDGADLVAEFDSMSPTTLKRRYVHGPGVDEPLVWYEIGSTGSLRRWYHADERGSIVATSNENGTLHRSFVYDEYGIPGATNSGRFQYTGQMWLPTLGMYSYKARIYSPSLGRFLQTDPIGYGDGMNLYAYVGADPVNMVDPTGLNEEDKPAPEAPENEEIIEVVGRRITEAAGNAGDALDLADRVYDYAWSIPGYALQVVGAAATGEPLPAPPPVPKVKPKPKPKPKVTPPAKPPQTRAGTLDTRDADKRRYDAEQRARGVGDRKDSNTMKKNYGDTAWEVAKDVATEFWRLFE